MPQCGYRMFNIIEDKSQPPRNVIKYYNTRKFRYNGYLAISVFKLSSSIIVVDIWLSEV